MHNPFGQKDMSELLCLQGRRDCSLAQRISFLELDRAEVRDDSFRLRTLRAAID